MAKGTQTPTYNLATQGGRYQSALDRNLKAYQDMIAEMGGAKAAVGEIPSEYQDIVNIYKTGGEYGAGAKAAIEAERQKGVAGAQAGLVSTGMSSGSMAVGVGQRYRRAAGLATQQVEDVRYEKLGTALTALASAKEARGQRVGTMYATTAQLIGGWKEPTTSEFASQEELARTEQETALVTSQAQIKAQSNLEAARISAQESLQKQAQQFEAAESAKYKVTAPEQVGLSKAEIKARMLTI